MVWPESSQQPLSRRSSPAERAAEKTLAEALEPRAVRVALAVGLAVLTAPGTEASALSLSGRSAAGRDEGSGGGTDGSSGTEGHSSAPTPGPGPGGSGGGGSSSAGGGGAASGSSASTTLVSVYIKIPASVMLRLGVSARSPRQTFFVLIPEKPD